MLVRTLVFAGLLCLAAVSISAQNFVSFNHAIGVDSDEVSDAELQKAKAALNLTDVQVNALKALLKMRAESTHQLLLEVEAAHRKLNEASRQGTASPTELGTAYLAVQTLHQRMKAAHDKFRTDFEAVLTAAQRSSLTRLNAASEQIEALRHLGLLDSHHFEMAFPAHEMGGVAFSEPGFKVKHIGPGHRLENHQ